MKRYAFCVLSLFFAVFSSNLHAQPGYPDKPVKLVVGFAPGGGNDILARLMAERLQETLGQPFLVENRAGASGMIAINAVKRSPADGYTLLVGPSSGMAVNPFLFTNIQYDPVKDFAPISLVGDFPMVVTVNPASKAQTLKQFLDIARKSQQPLHVGSGATSFQLAAAVFASKAGFAVENVSYRGNGMVVTALLANEVEFALVDAAAVLPQIRAGKLRALGVTGGKRFLQLPDVPTVAEAGVSGFAMSFWSGLFAPAGTPAAVVDKLQDAVAQAVRRPDMRQRLLELGIEPVGSSVAELANALSRDLVLYKNAATLANLKPE
jgi:tripartite-type tricarboxylate transporter receptor subunit TctC